MRRSKTPEARLTKQSSKHNLHTTDKYKELEDDFLSHKLKNDFLKEQDQFFSFKKDAAGEQQILIGDYIDPSIFKRQKSTISDQSTNDTASNSLIGDKLPISSFNMNISLSNPQQIFNILQMYPQETKIIDLRHSQLQKECQILNSIPIPLDQVDLSTLKKNFQNLGNMMGWTAKMKTDWKHRDEFFLIIIASHYKLGPILQANAYCQVSNLQDIKEKIEEQQEIFRSQNIPRLKVNRSATVFNFNQISNQLNQMQNYQEEDQFKELERQMLWPMENLNLSQKQIKQFDRIGFFIAANLISQLLQKNKNQEVYLSVDGFNDIQKHYQFLCHVKGKQLYEAQRYGFPNEILSQKLYLGNKFHAENFKLLKYLGITHILNVTRQIDNSFEGQAKCIGIIYKKINIKDENSTQIKIQFPLAYEWIDQALKTPSKTLTHKFTGKYHDKVIKRKAHINFSPSAQWDLSIDGGIIDVQCKLTPSKYYVDTPQNDTHMSSESQDGKGKIIEFQIDSLVKRLVNNPRQWGNDSKVFVHCRQGMSRSATLVIMYIMRKFKLSLADSVRFVRSRRICIDPNDGFMKQLGQFQKKLFQ